MSATVYMETNAEEVAYTIDRDNARIQRALIKATKEIKREILRRYRRTTATWHGKPKFEVLSQISGYHIEMVYGTDDPVWLWLDRGTSPHPIAPRRHKHLYYQRFFKPKTKVGQLLSMPGGKYGDYIRRNTVHHPGFEGRGWTKMIHREMDSKSEIIVYRHVKRVT